MKEFEATQLPTDKKLFADTILRYDEAIRRMDKAIKSLRREFKKAEKIVSNQGRELVNMNGTKPQIKRFRELVDVKSYEPQLEGLRVAWNRMKQKVEDAKNNIVRIGMWNSSRKL
jgi:seryl-tRNA synthetase